jgi:hypothetical protein
VAPALLALALSIAACGGSARTPTPAAAPTSAPSPTAARAAATPTPAPSPTATRPGPSSPAALGSPGTPGSPRPPLASPIANPAAVVSAFDNLKRLDSYHLEIKATGLERIVPGGVGSSLTIATDYYRGDQHTIIEDPTTGKQEAYKVGDKVYLVDASGQVTEPPSMPLLFTLPDLLYLNLTSPGITTFTQAGSEQVNGRATTRYNGTGNLARLAANPLLAGALAGATGEIRATIWIDAQGGFLVAADLAIETTAPQPGTARMRMDVTGVNQGNPIRPPR